MLFCPPEAIIRFSEVKYSVQEPQVPGEIAVVKIPVVRLGDTSKVSVVRVHTKDGSATSGEDYNPLSQGQQIRLHTQTPNLSNLRSLALKLICSLRQILTLDL